MNNPTPSPKSSGKNWVFLANHGVTFVLNFIILIVISRQLTAETFVEYSVLLALMNALIPIGTLGLMPFLIRHANTTDRRRFDLGYITRVSFGIGQVLALAGLTVAIFLIQPHISLPLFLWLAAAISLGATANVARGFFRSQRRSNAYLAVNAGQKLLFGAIVIFGLLITPMAGSSSFLFGATTISLAIVLLVVRKPISPPLEKTKARGRAEIREALFFLIPVSASNALLQVSQLIERSFLSGAFSPEETATYIFNFELAARFAAALMLVMKLIVWPHVAHGDPVLEHERYQKALLRVTLLVPITLLMSLALSLSVSGTSFQPLYFNADLFMLACVFVALGLVNYTVSMGIMLTGHTHITLIGGVVFVATHICGLFLLVPYFGVVGAGYALIVAQIFSTVYRHFANLGHLKAHANKAT